jgi:hypothetical protein
MEGKHRKQQLDEEQQQQQQHACMRMRVGALPD